MLRSRINVVLNRRAALPSPSRAALSSSCPACARTYSSPSTPRAKPAAAVAQASSGYEPGVMYSSSSKPEPEPFRFNPLNSLRPATPVSLPTPLPADVTPAPGSLHDELFMSTAAIDTISILSICATRPEFVPRAFLIFNQMLDNVKKGNARNPESKVWATVIKAMEKLGKPESDDFNAERTAEMWRHRAAKLVREWEDFQLTEQQRRNGDRQPGLRRLGILIYRAWFAAMVESGTSLEPMLPYLEHPDIGVKQLVDGLLPGLVPTALAQLEEFATQQGRSDILKQVAAARAVDEETKAFEERSRKLQEVPEVTPVPDKIKEDGKTVDANGVPALKEAQPHDQFPQARFVISNLRDTLKTLQTPLSNYNRQMALEKASYEAAEEELKHSARQLEEAGVQAEQRLQRNVLQAHMHHWHQALTAHLEKDIKRMRAALNDADLNDAAPPSWSAAKMLKESTLLLYLSVLPPKKLGLITILEVMRMVGSGGITDGMKTLRGCLGVGKAVESEHRADTIRNVAGPGSRFWQKTLSPKTYKPDRSNISKVWAEIGREREERLAEEAQLAAGANVPVPVEDIRSVWTPPWTQMVQMSVGSYLVDALIKTAKITRYGKDPETGETVSEDQAAFSHTYEYVRGKKLGVIRINPAVSERLASDSVRQVIHPKHLPMLVPPRPWAAWNDGAYLVTPVQAMRFKDSVEQVNYLREASRSRHLDTVFHGLDVLSATPWRINRQVFDVVLECWNKGEAIADIPGSPENTHYDVPKDLDPRENDPTTRQEYNEKKKMVAAQMRKDHGERCKYNYNLEIARSYLNDTFYIPHNMDFRGRAYPIPPHLSPVGDDLCRGLLTFGVKKPLGPTGLKWLQIHLANVYGFDKASFEERAQFGVEHEADVFDSADNPLTGKRWWLKAEDPWQCLATCFELAAALRSPDPTKFESSLPVHQDGTCNGMQHYAALGGDVRGAKAVNLEKGDRPADIYSGVADLVNASIAEDQKQNMPVALSLELPLGRKVVKQTVMTTVYGVTFIGAREQIAKQLTARGGMNGDEVYLASTYVARKVLDSIGDLFSGARAIQEWLTYSARLIARSISAQRLQGAIALRDNPVKTKGRPKKAAAGGRLAKELMTAVVWTSPLGLPVVQPYRKEAKKQVMTSLQTVYIADPNLQSEVAPQKQATAFPPNYIHSLDATHMLLTAAKCNQNDITFASVHDSYWTHAATVESMSETIRDTFIHLHTQDLIGELRKEFLQRYGDHYIPVNPGSSLLAKAKKRTVAPKKKKAEETDEDDVALAETGSAVDEVSDAEAIDADSVVDESDTIKDGEEGLNMEELSSEIEIVTFGTQRFVRFRDVLPPTPPRGQFDVKRIRDSQYFFS